MKVYGFDETDVQRGEMRAAKVDSVMIAAAKGFKASMIPVEDCHE